VRAAVVAAIAATVGGGCGGRVAGPTATPTAGVSIALYAGSAGGYAVIDDRRWVDVTGGALWLDDIDAGAELPSLVIESLSGKPLALGACTHERMPQPDDDGSAVPNAVVDLEPNSAPEPSMPVVGGRPYVDGRPRDVSLPPPPPPPPPAAYAPSPAIRCEVRGGSGRRLIRVLYSSAALVYRGEHDIALTGASADAQRARIATRFAIATPRWRPRDGAAVRADAVLYDGVPGGDKPPVELARGRIAVDGSTAIIALPARDAAARLRRVYDGGLASDATIPPTQTEWNVGSQTEVWVWLELAGIELPPGPLLVHAELPGEPIRDVVVPGDNAVVDMVGKMPTLRVPAWVDDDLHGSRTRTPLGASEGHIIDRVSLNVIDLGDVPREVWLEERIRPAHRRIVSHAFPDKPVLHGDTLRTKLVVKPGEAVRAGYVVEYAF
jgi:hypothetical protein